MRIHGLLLCLAALIAFGCGREWTDPNPAALALPAVDTLTHKRDLAFTDSDRTRLGKDFDGSLPNQGIAVAGNALTFTSTADGEADVLANFAYAIYRLCCPATTNAQSNLSGRSRQQGVRPG